MIRRLNFTGRKKIPRSRVQVSLVYEIGQPLYFNAQLDLENLGLPDKAHVYIEAYKRTFWKRFDFGTIAQVKIPEVRTLDNLEQGVTPLFRIKVVDEELEKGRIAGIVDKVVPKGADQGEKDKVSLLHVDNSEDLGGQIWRLEIENADWPVLLVNNNIDSIKEIVKTDVPFFSLVYPEVVRQVLRYILDSDLLDPEIDKEDWPALWLEFVSSMPGVGSPPAGPEPSIKIEQEEWVESAVRAFTVKWQILEQYKKLHDSVEDE